MNNQRNQFFIEAPIAVFDILGFRQLIKTSRIKALPEIFKMIINLKERICISYGDTPFIRTKLISDTILIYVDPQTLIQYSMKQFDQVNSLLQAAANLLVFCGMKGIPIRGACTYGEYYVDVESKLIMGTALIKAYDLEKQQDWMGAIIDQEYEQLYRDSFDRYQWNSSDEHLILVPYRAPMKSGSRNEYCCIGWPNNLKFKDLKEINKHIEQAFIRGVSEDKMEHAVYRKMRNTIDFAMHCHTKKMYQNGEKKN